MKSKLTFLEVLIIIALILSVGSVVHDLVANAPMPINQALGRPGR